MQKRSKLEHCFKSLYDLPINASLPSPQNIKVFHKAIECIAELGEPKDAIELLMLIDFDKSKPSFTMHLKRAGEVISSLMTKQSVREEWPVLEEYSRACLIKCRDLRVDETIHFPEFNVCCQLGCCEHPTLYGHDDFEKIRLVSSDIIPLVKDNFKLQIAAHLLGIASLDPDGYVREAALKEMQQLDTEAVLPYVLLRLNDWVPQVATLAQNILKEMIEQESISIKQIEWCRPLIDQLGRKKRTNLRSLQSSIYQYAKRRKAPIQKVNRRKELSYHFRLAYSFGKIIKSGIGSVNDIKEFRLSINFISKHGEPSDAIGLLPLIDPSEPMMFWTNKLAGAVAILMNKTEVRTQWKEIEQFYRNALRKKGNWSLEKTFLSSKEMLPKIREKLAPNDAIHLLGIASFDPDGHVREAALKEMEQLNTDSVLPYVLLRLNDWVSQVATYAQHILKNMLESKKVSVAQLVWCRPLFDKLAKETQADLIDYMESPDHRSEGLKLLDSVDEEDKNFLASIYGGVDEKKE